MTHHLFHVFFLLWIMLSIVIIPYYNIHILCLHIYPHFLLTYLIYCMLTYLIHYLILYLTLNSIKYVYVWYSWNLTVAFEPKMYRFNSEWLSVEKSLIIFWFLAFCVPIIRGTHYFKIIHVIFMLIKRVKVTVDMVVLKRDCVFSCLWLPRPRMHHSLTTFECLALGHSTEDQSQRV